MRPVAALFCLFLLVSCQSEDIAPTPQFHASENPQSLSEWGMLRATRDTLLTGFGVEPYDLNTPLFSDHAGKFRTIWMPEGASARYSEEEVFDFPVGTVITKTFFYPVSEDGLFLRGDVPADVWAAPGTLDLASIHLVETRILVRRETGWVALPYVWNEDQTDAVLMRTGDMQHFTLTDGGGEIEVNYLVPNANQCQGCHATNNTTREIQPIGPAARHLNRDFDYGDGPVNQIDHLVAAGYLTGAPSPDEVPQAPDWTDTRVPVEARARAWLDINCAHCHNPAGPADTSGLYLDPGTPMGPNFGLCKVPIAAGPGSGGHRFDIVPGRPDESILIFRMESLRPDIMMPELGRSVFHAESVALMREWISGLEGACS